MSETIRKSILVVDDNEDDELLTVDALRGCGYTAAVDVVRDGAEALDWLFGTGSHAKRDASLQPQLVLLDLKLPKVSGIEVLERVRENATTKYVPIVVLSSSAREEDIVTSYDRGANSYVRKAMEFSEFSEALRCLCKYWLQYNEVAVRG